MPSGTAARRRLAYQQAGDEIQADICQQSATCHAACQHQYTIRHQHTHIADVIDEYMFQVWCKDVQNLSRSVDRHMAIQLYSQV